MNATDRARIGALLDRLARCGIDIDPGRCDPVALLATADELRELAVLIGDVVPDGPNVWVIEDEERRFVFATEELAAAFGRTLGERPWGGHEEGIGYLACGTDTTHRLIAEERDHHDADNDNEDDEQTAVVL